MRRQLPSACLSVSVWVLPLPLSLCLSVRLSHPFAVCVWVMQSASTCFSTENALNPELEFASRKRFASQIRKIHTHSHTHIVTYLPHTRTQTLEIAKIYLCVFRRMSPPSWVWAKFLSKINIWATKNMPVCGSVAFVSASVCVCVFRGAKEIWKYLESTNCRIMWSSLQTFLLLYICVTLSPPSARIVVVSRGRPLSLFAWVSCRRRRRRRCRIVSVCVAQNCCFSDDCLLLLFLLARPAGALWYQNAKNKPNLNYNFFFASSLLF